jgi:hypothetical protein
MTNFAEAWARLIDPTPAIELGKPRRGIELAEHVAQLDRLVKEMRVARDEDERYAIECVGYAEDAEEFHNALLAGGRTIQREVHIAMLAAFIAGLRCAQQMSTPRKSPRRKLHARRSTKPRRARGGAR